MQNFFTAINYKLIGISLGLLVLGYIFLAQGPVNNPLSKTIAPIVLVGVYCVLIPVAIAVRGKDTEIKDSAKKKPGV